MNLRAFFVMDLGITIYTNEHDEYDGIVFTPRVGRVDVAEFAVEKSAIAGSDQWRRLLGLRQSCTVIIGGGAYRYTPATSAYTSNHLSSGLATVAYDHYHGELEFGIKTAAASLVFRVPVTEIIRVRFERFLRDLAGFI